jgi:thiol-disulfide isomerase/thioredoxin
MNDGQTEMPPAGKPAGSNMLLYILAAAFAAIAGFGAITIGDFLAREQHFAERHPAPSTQSTAQNTGGNLSATSTGDGKGGMTKLVRAAEPKELAPVTFQDEAGRSKSLADWKGKVVLVNLWATWCAPCKLEMPSLSRLQAQLGGADFAVLPISLDRQGVELPRKFLTSSNLGNLPLLIDPTAGLAGKLDAIGLPASIILDREGREIARLLGPAEWDSAPAMEVIRAAIAGTLGQ